MQKSTFIRFFERHSGGITIAGSFASIASLAIAIALAIGREYPAFIRGFLLVLIVVLSVIVFVALMAYLSTSWPFGIRGKRLLGRDQFATYCDLCTHTLDHAIPGGDGDGILTVQTPIYFDEHNVTQKQKYEQYVKTTTARLVDENLVYRRIVVLFSNSRLPEDRATRFACGLVKEAVEASGLGRAVDLKNVHLAFLHETLFPSRIFASVDIHSISDKVYSIAFARAPAASSGTWEFGGSVHLRDPRGATGSAIRQDLLSLWHTCVSMKTIVSVDELFKSAQSSSDPGIDNLVKDIIDKQADRARHLACSCPLDAPVEHFVNRMRREPEIWSALCNACRVGPELDYQELEGGSND